MLGSFFHPLATIYVSLVNLCLPNNLSFNYQMFADDFGWLLVTIRSQNLQILFGKINYDTAVWLVMQISITICLHFKQRNMKIMQPTILLWILHYFGFQNWLGLPPRGSKNVGQIYKFKLFWYFSSSFPVLLYLFDFDCSFRARFPFLQRFLAVGANL